MSRRLVIDITFWGGFILLTFWAFYNSSKRHETRELRTAIIKDITTDRLDTLSSFCYSYSHWKQGDTLFETFEKITRPEDDFYGRIPTEKQFEFKGLTKDSLLFKNEATLGLQFKPIIFLKFI